MATAQQVHGLERFGHGVLAFLEEAGRLVLLFSSTVRWVLRGVLEWRQTVLQMARIGISGTGQAIVKGRKVSLRKGSLLLIEARETHEIKNNGRQQLITVNFYAPPVY